MKRISHRDLKMHAKKILLVQEQGGRDYAVRITLCQDMIQYVHQEVVVIFSDEPHYHLSGTVNKQH